MQNESILDYFKQFSELRDLPAYADYKHIKIAVLRSYTLDLIEPILSVLLASCGYRAEFFIGEYNQYSQEILDPGSALYAFAPDVILLMSRIEEILPTFVEDFNQHDFSQWDALIENQIQHIDLLVSTLEKQTSATVLLQNMVLTHASWGAFDAQTTQGQAALVSKFNQALAALSASYNGAFLWDYANFVSQYGLRNLIDPKLWYVAKNPFKKSAYIDLCKDLFRYLMSLLGHTKKCIVLDLDNTLWGGVVGEDGLEGIELGHDYPGSCYVDFQRKLLSLNKKGMVLCINSKNNEQDALSAIENHPCMILRKENFSVCRINWQDKVSNLREIAEQLNIGLESIVFIDDNPVECEFVKENLACDVIQLPSQKYLIPSVLDDYPFLETLRLTNEDRNKSKIYAEQSKRAEYKASASSLEAYLNGLQTKLDVKLADAYAFPRLAQLTQKTNQFNMTTKRYTESDIQQFVALQSADVFSVSASDKFGDNGIVGCVILRYEGNVAEIDTFLLSCRVIGRRIENAVFATLVKYLKYKQVIKLNAAFIKTQKNAPAENFYNEVGMLLSGDGLYQLSLEDCLVGFPDCVEMISEAHEG